jgi:peptidoglycan hydrolase-like protein with peptidoglycan-binding domain
VTKVEERPFDVIRVFVLLLLLYALVSPAMARSVANADCSEKKYSVNVVRAVQTALKDAGLFKGRADGGLRPNGEVTPETEKAITDYRRLNGLPSSKRIDPEFLRALLGKEYQLDDIKELQELCQQLTVTNGNRGDDGQNR